MLPIVHEIDPCADTIVILEEPCQSFAPFVLFRSFESFIPQKRELRQKRSTVSSTKKDEKKKEISQLQTRQLDENHDKELASTAAANAPTTVLAESIKPSPKPIFESTGREVHYLVSSRHLILASPWFRRLLSKGLFAEGLKDPLDGRFHIRACEWDENALLILLNILHIRTRQVPETVDLETLAKIAVLVDYYELQNAEVMDRDVENWTANLKHRAEIPSCHCRDLMLWICVSHMFSMRQEFWQATAMLIKSSHNAISTFGLPIRDEVMSRIKRNRCDAIEYVVSQLHHLLETYKKSEYQCPRHYSYSFQCGVFLYGTLMKLMHDWRLVSPRPKAPFEFMTFNALCGGGQWRTTPSWWHEKVKKGYNMNVEYEAHACNIDSTIKDILAKAAARIAGLDLDNQESNTVML